MEDKVLQLIIEKGNWEEIIYYIVGVEKMDPWNIDLVKLTSSFINFINQAKELDFRIPAKVVFVAAILLRLKAEFLDVLKKDEELKFEKEEEMLEFNLNGLELEKPILRIPKRQIVLDDLIRALKKALEVREKKERRLWERKKLVMRDFSGVSIEERIGKLMEKIKRKMEKANREMVAFREVVEKWEREQIVENFVPLLHLEQGNKVDCKQEDFFKEIWIKPK